MTTQFDALKQHTVIVADTGDIESIKLYNPTDATTNPSLLLASAGDKKYAALFERAIAAAQKAGGDVLTGAMDRISVEFGQSQ